MGHRQSETRPAHAALLLESPAEQPRRGDPGSGDAPSVSIALCPGRLSDHRLAFSLILFLPAVPHRPGFQFDLEIFREASRYARSLYGARLAGFLPPMAPICCWP